MGDLVTEPEKKINGVKTRENVGRQHSRVVRALGF